MLIVRETFIARPGRAGELAQLMKKEMGEWEGFKGNVMLDMVTDYNTIVVEYEIASLVEFEKMMDDHRKAQKKSSKEKAKSKDKKPPYYTELYQTGRREIFRVVE